MLTSRGLGRVLGDLASMGFDARWGVLGAADVGANHQRDRIWIVGKVTNTNSIGLQKPAHQQELESQGCNQLQIEQSRNTSNVANADSAHGKGNQCAQRTQSQYANPDSASWWKAEPNVGRVADGVACRVDRLKAIGNGQVPLCAATAWRILNERTASTENTSPTQRG